MWLYNLHYFDELNAEHAAVRGAWHGALIARWIAENPPGQGNGWEPYPVSMRVVNWIKWALSGHVLSDEAHHSLAIQVRYLSRRLEWHLLGNHLFANGKALVFAGLFFEGREAEGWLKKGLQILAREVPEQILADGGHFERSPMYHAIILEDLLDLTNLARAFGHPLPREFAHLPEHWKAKALGMLRWLRATAHPDGEISLFNDAAFAIAAPPAALVGYAHRLGLEDSESGSGALTHLEDTGYIRVQKGEAVAILDVGQIGPDYLPGHAHADSLTFELSLFGRRVVVDSGTSRYDSGPERLRQRSTSAHNTVEIDGANSSEVWSAFRVARRAYPRDLQIVDVRDTVAIRCAHDGYRRLKGRPIHKREWTLHPGGLSIIDEVTGGTHRSVARFHFHPQCSPVQRDRRSGTISIEGGGEIRWSLTQGEARIVNTTYHPQFGLSVGNKCLEVELLGSRAETRFEWGI